MDCEVGSMQIIQYLFLMLWCHFLDDYVLQGVLAKMKQKQFWVDNAPDKLYKYDYLMALGCHAMMWSISIMIPTIFTGNFIWWLIPINFVIHFIVDDLKANRFKINLVIDQSIHFVQVALTFLVCYVWLV